MKSLPVPSVTTDSVTSQFQKSAPSQLFLIALLMLLCVTSSTHTTTLQVSAEVLILDSAPFVAGSRI